MINEDAIAFKYIFDRTQFVFNVINLNERNDVFVI